MQASYKVEKQPEGWAVIINDEVWTWAVTEEKAHALAQKLSKAVV